MDIVTFCSFKGGTAKTSVAMHLGSCLSKKHRVLLVDLDPQANLSTGIGIGPDADKTMVSVLKGSAKIDDVIMQTGTKNLDLIPGNAWLDGVERSPQLCNNPYSHELLRDALDEKKDDYDYCFIDTPPSLGWLTQSAFFSAKYSIVCATPEAYSIIALRRLHEFHDSINKYHKVENLGVVLSFWYDRGAVNQTFIEEIEESFPGKLFNSKIHRDIQVSRAVLKGCPVTEFDPKCRASVDYKKLAQEFLKKLGKHCSKVEAVSG